MSELKLKLVLELEKLGGWGLGLQGHAERNEEEADDATWCAYSKQRIH